MLPAPSSGIERIRNSTRMTAKPPRARTIMLGAAGRFGITLSAFMTAMATAMAAIRNSRMSMNPSAFQPVTVGRSPLNPAMSTLYHSRNSEMKSRSPEPAAIISPNRIRVVSKFVGAAKASLPFVRSGTDGTLPTDPASTHPAHAILQAVIDPLAEIEDLSAFGNRLAGTDAERRAANHLKGRLEEGLGRDARTEPTLVRPRWPLAHLVHALLAIAGSAIAVKNATLGTILVAVATVATIGEVTGRLPLTSRITGRRASQNVVSEDAPKRPGTLLLTAHYDTARGGAVFGARTTRAMKLGLGAPFVASLLVLLATCAARLAGAEGTVVSAIQFVPTVALIVSLPFLADVLLSGPVPGANDNASGVATVLRLAERYGDDLEHLDVTVLLTGAQESGARGIQTWIKRHRKTLDPQSTIVLSVDEVGYGTVQYAVKEGPVLAIRQHKQLRTLCDQIRDEDADEGRYGARPITSRSPGDAWAARSRGLPAITVSCAGEDGLTPNHHRPSDTPDQIDGRALDRAFGFCSELIELIDEKIGPDIAAIADEHASFTPS